MPNSNLTHFVLHSQSIKILQILKLIKLPIILLEQKELEVVDTTLTFQILLERVLFQRCMHTIKLSINLLGSKAKFVNCRTQTSPIYKFGLNFQLDSKLNNNLVMIIIFQYLISRSTDMNDITGQIGQRSSGCSQCTFELLKHNFLGKNEIKTAIFLYIKGVDNDCTHNHAPFL